MFVQSLPSHSLLLTVFAALIPLILLLILLAVLRVTAWLAVLLASIATLVVGVLVWHAPLAGTLKAYWCGSLEGVWVIDWITFWGVVIFNTVSFTGDFWRTCSSTRAWPIRWRTVSRSSA